MTGVFAGTAPLLAAQVRAERRALTLSALALAALVAATGWGITTLYATPAQRAAYAATAGISPAVAAVNGRGYDLTELGGITAYEVGFIGLIVFPVVAMHLAIRLTRRDEDAGLLDLLTAGRIGRLAPLAAAGLALAATLSGFVIVAALGLQAAGLPAAGSWRYALGLGLFTAASGAVGLVAAEIGRDARTAYALSLILLLISFVRRAIVDGRGLDPSWSGAAGQLAEIRAWGEQPRWAPLVTYAAGALLAWALAALVRWHRDLAGGLLAPRPGPGRGGPRLGTVPGLVWRMLRSGLGGWLLGTVVWAATLGGLSGEMTEIVRNNPAMLAAFPVDRPEHLVTSLALLLCALGGAAFGVQALTRWAADEGSGRIGLLLAAPTSRHRLWLGWVAGAGSGAGLIVLAGAASLGLSTALATGRPAGWATAVAAGGALLPAVLLIVAVGAAAPAMVPRAAGLAWLLIGWATVVGLLAQTLRLPTWARALSPLHAVGLVPVQEPRVSVLVLLTGFTVAVSALAAARFAARDLVAG